MSHARQNKKVSRSPRRTGGFLLQDDGRTMRDPLTVKQWMVLWTYQGQDFALKGAWDFIADLAAAFRKAETDFFWIMARANPGAAYWRNPPLGALCKVDLIPCVQNLPFEYYVRARDTAWEFKRDDFWRFWDNFLDEYGEGLPDVFKMMELRT